MWKGKNYKLKLLNVCLEIELHKKRKNDRKSLTVADPIQMVHKRNPTMFDGLPPCRPRSIARPAFWDSA